MPSVCAVRLAQYPTDISTLCAEPLLPTLQCPEDYPIANCKKVCKNGVKPDKHCECPEDNKPEPPKPEEPTCKPTCGVCQECAHGKCEQSPNGSVCHSPDGKTPGHCVNGGCVHPGGEGAFTLPIPLRPLARLWITGSLTCILGLRSFACPYGHTLACNLCASCGVL